MPNLDQPLRILRVVHTLRREAGGPSESVLRSSAALIALGHQVEIATADAPGTPPPDNADFRFHPLGGLDEQRLGTWLQREHARFDAVLVQGLWQGGWAVRQALAGTGTPYFVFPHGMLDPWIARHYPWKHFKKQLYWWLRESRVLRDAAAVCFTCEEERRLARQTFWPYSVTEKVVAYGTAEPPANHDALRATFATRFPALASRRFILFLGRIHEKKGVHELIAGYAAYRQTHTDAPALVIAGPCADERYLEKLKAQTTSHPTITWLPMLGGDLKWGALLSAEVFILPSHQENFGLAVAEALACARPVLISDKVNIWREIDRADAGYVATDTKEGVVSLLTRWAATTPPQRAAMSEAAKACFAQHFEITNAAKSLAGVLHAYLPERD